MRALASLAAILLASPALAQASSAPAPTFGQDLLTMRDPFRMPEIVGTNTEPKSELELYALHEFKLLGVMTGPNRIRAMVQGPNGKTHFLSENDKIGTKKGLVKKITPEGIVVEERLVNVLGEEEISLTELKVNENTGEQ